MLFLNQTKNTKQQGDIGMGLAIAWFTQNGYRVSIPLTDSQDYDVVVESDYRFYSVQIRTTYYKKPNGIYQLNLRVFGGNRSGTGKVKHIDPEVVDYLFAVTDASDMYLIPTKVVTAKNVLSLGEKCVPYKVS